MSSFKQLMRDGVLKRADAHKVHIEDIIVQVGFNARENDERLAQHVDALAAFIIGGGRVPPLEVEPLDNGRVKVVDGHCRLAAFSIALAAGHKEFEWVSVVPFSGDDADRTARICTSNEGLKLTQLETARVYQRLRDEHGMTPEGIAAKVGKTRQHVDQLLILADAPEDVHQLVKDGAVSPTLAMQMVRTHGDEAGEMLRKQMGGGKVTPKAMKPWAPPAKIATALVEELDAFVTALPNDARERLANIEDAVKRGALPDGQMVSVPAGALLALLGEHADACNARQQAEAKARDRAAKAAQREMPV